MAPGRDDHELARRLRESVGHRVPDDVRAQHLRAIGAALSTAPDAPVAAAPVVGRLVRLRRGIAAIAATVTVMVPAGVAVAAQDALPGHALYDVKRATETVIQVVDPAIQARNRIDELERLFDAGIPLPELEVAVGRALDAVQTVPADDPLQLRLLGLLHRYDELVAATRQPAGDESSDDDDRSGSGSGDDDRSGAGSGEHDTDDAAGDAHTDDDAADDDRSGSGSGSETGSETETEPESDDDSSGPGSGDDNVDDSSGPGSGDDDLDDDLDDDSTDADSGSDG